MGKTSNASKKKVVAKASSTLRKAAVTPGIDKDLAFAILHELKKHINFKGSAQLFQQELEDMHLILTDQVVQGQLMLKPATKRAAGTPLPNETTDYLDKKVSSFANKESTRGSSNKHNCDEQDENAGSAATAARMPKATPKQVKPNQLPEAMMPKHAHLFSKVMNIVGLMTDWKSVIIHSSKT